LQAYIRTLLRPSASVPDGICRPGTDRTNELLALDNQRVNPTAVLPNLPSLGIAYAIIDRLLGNLKVQILNSVGDSFSRVPRLVSAIVLQQSPDHPRVVVCKGTNCDIVVPARQ